MTIEALNTILVNLVENARKYAPVDPQKPNAEPLRVDTRLRRGKVVLEVSDRGPGIPPEERELVFEAFYRVGNETMRSSKGTGLGLHLVALQSEAIGASVAIFDRTGGGCTFRITFKSANPPA
jgi:signal transduction histidine kinase